MKRILSLTLAVLFVATMAAVTFATDTTFEGQYRVRAWSEWNFDKKAGYLPNNSDPQYNGWFDQRFRLTITHTRSEFLKAVVRFDLADDTWGQERAFYINNNANGGKIDHAYIVATLPKIGTFTVGKQPVDFGYDLVFSADAPGVDGLRWENTWGPVTVAAMYFKLNDNIVLGGTNRDYNRDANMWALDLKYAVNDKHLVNLFGGVVIDDAGWAPSVGGPWGSYDLAMKYNNYTGGAAPDSSMTLGFVGLAYTGNIADMIDIKFENSWVFGTLHQNLWAGGTPAADISVGGWNVYLDVAYYNDLFRVGLAFVMGSGAEHDWNVTSLRHINMPYIREENWAFANIIGNGYGGYNSVWTAPGFGDNAENLTAVKLYFEISPIEKLTLNAAVIWAKWTDPVGTNPLMDPAAYPAYPHPVNWYSNYGAVYQSWTASDDLGWEIDFGFNYEIMEGLDYTFAAGVLLTGDSFDYVNAAGTREDWGPIWSISNVLRYTF